MIEVYAEESLAHIPDGSIIEWERIAGDQTSTAVAYLHREVEAQTDADGRTIAEGPVTWISPGGWQPMTVEEAGLTYPVRVVRLGPDNPPAPPAIPELPEFGTLLSGGTYPRDHALECASRAWAGMSAIRDRDGAILATAEKFLEWLNREPTDATD
ncbi:hypothetical protein SEA_ZENTENO07_64 [Mycobacterium phage Zenteno07]|nr:hypothetical protein SEA_ZENTENO07_64 [Mycobacterium phage Zenteno07]